MVWIRRPKSCDVSSGPRAFPPRPVRRSYALRRAAFILAGAAVLGCVAFLLPELVRAWGDSTQKLVINKAIDTLPSDLRAYFEANRTFLLTHVTDAYEAIAKNPAERHNHYIALDKYGRFPFAALPREYKTAFNKYGRSKLESNGVLPWEVGVYSEKLTEAFREGHWEEARENAALLAYYVTEAHDPFNTTENFDGRLSNQTGVNERFGTALVDRYSSFLPMRPNDASYIADPTDHAFEICLDAHSSLESVLLADLRARKGENSYNDEYYDRFYNFVAPTLLRQISNSASDVGSYWLTAWTNAGKPQLPH